MYVERDMLQTAHRLYIDSLIFFLYLSGQPVRMIVFPCCSCVEEEIKTLIYIYHVG